MAAAVEDPSITRELFTGFDGSGATGLVLFPESLRHLFSFGDPILTPADVKGATVQAIGSRETSAIIEALGGHAVDLSDADYQQGIEAGTVDATDSGFVLSTLSPSNQRTTATGNVALYAKVISLVVNTAFWDGLSEDRRAIIERAAEATRSWAIAHQLSDADAAVAFCGGGGRVVLADHQGLEAFRDAEAPMYASLEDDPSTRGSLAAIHALAAAGDASGVAACEPAQVPGELPPEGGALPDGLYRIEATEDYLQKDYPDYVPNAVGVYTFTLDDGRWSFDYVAPGGGKDHQTGTYQVDGSHIKWLWDPCCSQPNPVLDATWSVNADGTLRFEQLSGPPDWALALPFVRVGDLR